MNRAVLVQAIEDIERFPERFSLSHYGNETVLNESCGTVACVAGFITAREKQNALDQVAPTPHRVAKWALGLTDKQADNLFLADVGSIWDRHASEFGWKCYEDGGGLTKYSQVTAEQACIVLRRLLNGEIGL
jgi:hypothetical protein